MMDDPMFDARATDGTTLQVRVINYGGSHCERALRTVIENCDIPALASWRSVDGNELGNCFFSTTHAAMDLIRAGLVDDIFLVTGRFDHPDLEEPVFHAWLEFRAVRPHVVVNVSNLKSRPLYAMNRKEYYEINHCRRRVQEIPLHRLRIKARQMAERNGDAGGEKWFDLRNLTKKTLKPTLRKLGELQTAPRN